MAFPVKPRMSEMTFWKNNPLRMASGYTDHWAKIKMRTEVEPFRAPSPAYSPAVMLSWQEPWQPPPQQRPRRLSSLVLDNSYHHRAKEGFRYWLINRPKPTSFGRGGMGSYKTVLGLGDAPRT